MNLQKFYMGESFDAYEYFGAHLENGGVVFRTYAPNAWGINVVGEFNGWQEQPLQQLHQSGVWVGFPRMPCRDRCTSMWSMVRTDDRSIVIPMALVWNCALELVPSSVI